MNNTASEISPGREDDGVITMQTRALAAVERSGSRLDLILEALLLASEQPQSLEHLHRLLGEDLNLTKRDLREALAALGERLSGGATELIEVASGFRLQVRSEYTPWVSRLWQEKPPRLSRAMLETLALICYRQPITRGEIEEVRGVSLSPNILRNLQERGWVREVGVKEVPGRPSLFGTTQQLLDDLGLRSLDLLPSLPDIKDPSQLDAALTRLEPLPEGDEAGMADVSEADEEGVKAAPDTSEAAADLTQAQQP